MQLWQLLWSRAPRRGGNAGEEDSQCEPGDGLQAWHAVTQWFKPRSVVEQAASMARLISPKRTKNVSELQVAVMQWEPTFVERESKFSEEVADNVKTAAMRAMLPKDILERFFDGSFHYEELRNRVSAYVGEKLAGQDASRWSSTRGPSVRLTNPKVRTMMSMQYNSVVHLIDPTRKHKQESDNERKPFNCRTANSSLGFKGAKRVAHQALWAVAAFESGQAAGSNMNTTWEVADVRKPLISASRLLERGHKLVLDEKPRIQCKNGDIIPLERTRSLFAVRLWIPKGFHKQG